MKRLLFVMATVLASLPMLSVWTAFAQTPKVPITYEGDTDKTIVRRAQWIEGAKKEGKLVWWGTNNPSLKEPIIAEFNKVYPFINVEHWRGRGIEISAKLLQQHASGRLNVDVCVGSGTYNFPTWRKMGLIEPYTHIVPGIKRIPKKMYSIYGDWVQPGNIATAPQYNTNLVSADEAPKSYEDLLDPKWKGQIGMGSSGLKHWAALAVVEGGWGIEKTEDFLRKLRKQGFIWGRGFSGGHTLLIAGEFTVSAQGYVYHVFHSRNKGAPVQWVPVDPILITGPSLIKIRKGPHPNTSMLWIEWLLSPQGLATWDRITLKGAAFPGAGTKQSKALEGLNLVYRTEEDVIKFNDLGLIDRFANILGVTN